MLSFNNLFTDNVEYPSLEGDILPLGTMYVYMSSTFLNGLINYAGRPVRAYVMDEYNEWDDPLDDCVINIMEPPNSFKWQRRKFTTKSEVFEVLTEEGRLFHTNLSDFRDSVAILTYKNGVYWFFLFDLDASDCLIGRFTTELSQEKVIELFDDYIKNFDGHEKLLPNHVLQGWIKF